MKPKNRRFPSLEVLEDRLVPATVRFISGTLFISNPTVTGGTSNVTVTQTAPNTFSVVDNGAPNGTFAGVSNINYTGSNANDRFTVNLNGLTYTGSLFANAGNGNDTVSVANGNMRGNLQVFPGFGNDSVGLGSTAPLTVGGTTQVNDSAGNDSITLGNAAAASNFQGTVSMTGMNVIRVANGAADTYGGDLDASTNTEGVPLDFETANGAAVVTINGSLQLTGGANDDTVVDSSLLVMKNVNINLGGSLTAVGNFVSEQASGPFLQVNGNYSYTGGSGVDFLTLSGNTVGGSMTLNTGDGNDVVDLSTASSGTQPTVGGTLSLTMGNGNDSATVDAAVGGNMTFNLGSGNDTVTIGNAPGGVLNWTSGNGNDSVTFGDATNVPSTWNVHMQFGTGNDTLTLAGNGTVATPNALTGFVDMGGPPGGNAFDPTGSLAAGTWVILPPFSLQNV